MNQEEWERFDLLTSMIADRDTAILEIGKELHLLKQEMMRLRTIVDIQQKDLLHQQRRNI